MRVSLRAVSCVVAMGLPMVGTSTDTEFATAHWRSDAVPPSEKRVAAPHGTAADEAILRAALSSVPVARRPVGFITQTLNIVVSGTLPSAVTTVWALFPNGYATDCYGWDPRRTEPSPRDLGAEVTDCSFESWRRTADGIVLTDATGEHSGPYDLAAIRPFVPGQRVALRLRSYGSAVAAAGYISVEISDMVLTNAGTVRFTTTDRTWQGGGSTTRIGTNEATYRFDGYLAAVRFPDGRLELFFTGQASRDASSRDTDFIYLNGALFGTE